ncbi:MAG: TetR/AcrR family transcriptional regulator [Streptosporangiales bacterium]|nr:TetR/AcrR family transcriptional regulator [Streptosporangiales bacterium]
MGTETTAREPLGDTTAQRRPGRPRSEKVEQAILDATLEALTERGIEGVSLEDVAVRAGVGKSTLYRRWSGKEDLLIAAFGSLKRPLPGPAGESVQADLTAMLASMAADADDPRYACQFEILNGESERFPKLIDRYKNEVAEPRREAIRDVIRRGMTTGEVRPDADVEIALLALMGSVLSRDRQDVRPPAREFAERAVAQILSGIAAK